MKLRWLFIIIFSLICSNTLAQSSLDQLLGETPQQSPQSSAFNPSLTEEVDSIDELRLEDLESEEFLPVEEAYKLSVTHGDQGLNLDWVIADAYFLYGEQFHFSIDGKALEAKLPKGKVEYDTIFEKEVEKHYLFVQATIDQAQLPDGPFEILVTSQGCADAGLCYPPQTEKFIIDNGTTTKVDSGSPPISSSNISTGFVQQSVSWPVAMTMLAFAIAGGLILNLMPCVLPVLSLKALSLTQHQENNKAQGWSYTGGVISTFIVIATLLLVVRAAGQAIGWGFQLQSPGFVTLLIFLFFVMGLSLSGYINISAKWMGIGQSLTQSSGLKGSYFTGVLAAVVASPCTAPFMASAVGYAITQPWWMALSIFASLGFGMALPFLLLCYLPQLSEKLPKPGPWMETFKQALAFPLYLTAIWLLWVLSRQLGTDAAMSVILGALVIVFIFWLGQHINQRLNHAGLLTLVLATLLSWHNSNATTIEKRPTNSVWEEYNPQRLSELRQQGKPVFINMTADWCITCLANEKLVFTEPMLELMKNKQITLFKGDWTNYDPSITRLLEQYKRGGVPLYLLYPAKANAEAEVLPQILSPSDFRDKINEI